VCPFVSSHPGGQRKGEREKGAKSREKAETGMKKASMMENT
jgi:hypothetical protein